MTSAPHFTTVGQKTEDIDVRLSYKIVKLFSDGLYASPNKAIEELVANSFDAGALRVAVFLSANFHDENATIAVIDDGEGMDPHGLKQHWLIGRSNKRKLTSLPKGRVQIGKFGIGKLATYVLANRLSHICKKDGKYYSTTMDYRRIDSRGDEELEPKTPLKIPLNELNEADAIEALAPWTGIPGFSSSKLKLFGEKAASSWTCTIMSDLKSEKVLEIQPGTLEWVLRTALPLRPDFMIFLNGKKLESSKQGKGLLKKWVLGKDLTELAKPASDKIEPVEDFQQQPDSDSRFVLNSPTVGRISGFAEAYKDLLTGKSDHIGRSHGFFVFVRDRLINVTDSHFGIKPDELRHGTFGRIRVVVHMDGLDPYLQSDREHVRDGPILVDAQNVLRSIFNQLRQEIKKFDDHEDSGTKLARRLGDSPSNLTRRPIIEMARAVLEGKATSRYVSVPQKTTPDERAELIKLLEKRATETPELFVTGINIVFDATSDDGIANYDISTGSLRINGLHPFVGAFFDEFTSKVSGLPLEMFGMAEVLLESYMYEAAIKAEQIDQIMSNRDQLLRQLAQESSRRTAFTIANSLREARNNEDKLEVELIAAFNSLGFETTRHGKRGKPDGVATALLSAGADKQVRRYSVSLEAKSKEKDEKKVAAQTVGTAAIARQRDEFKCDHALVVGPAFPTAQGDRSALAKEIAADRQGSLAKGENKTITLINIDDLARLVQQRPLKRLTLTKIRELFITCSLPEDCTGWIDEVEKSVVKAPNYRAILEAIVREASDGRREPVSYEALRTALKYSTPPIIYHDVDDLITLCKALGQLAPTSVKTTNTTIELDQSIGNILAEIESSMKDYKTGTK